MDGTDDDKVVVPTMTVLTADALAELNAGRDPGKYPVTTGDGGPMARFAALMASADHRGLMEEICAEVVEGQSLWKIAKAKRLPRFPFAHWVQDDPERLQMYKAALMMRAEYHAAMVGDELDVVTTENWQAQKLRINTHQWFASRYNRMQYGDDKNNGPAVQNNITIVHRSE